MNDKHRENLKKLADYLASGKAHMVFDMRRYMTDGASDVKPEFHGCGTVACAAGHGPAAGVALPYINYPEDYTWSDYVRDVFLGGDAYSSAYKWLFHHQWQSLDNTPEGAAARIYYFLEHGVPNDYQSQILREAPLCYLDIVERIKADRERSKK